MTQKEFIQKFKTNICEKYNTTCVVISEDYQTQMCYVNHQDGEVVNDWATIIGFDEEGDFFIDFLDTNCTAYEEDMEDCNTEDAWDLLWEAITDEDDDYTPEFKVGDAVYWNYPAIDGYPEEERDEVLKRRFVVFKVSGDIIHISDTYTIAEVYADELVHIV